METKNRSKAAQSIIKNKLGKYFSEEQLSYLDDLGVETLSEYFSNAELRQLSEASPAVIKGMVDRHESGEVKRRLTHIEEEELEELMDWYKAECTEIEEVICPNHNEVIALELKHKTMKNSDKIHWDGRYIVAIGNRLAATRNRLDGVVGYQCNIPYQNPDFVDAMSKYFDDREAALKKYRDKVDKSKAAHERKVEKAKAAYMKKLESINQSEMKQADKDPSYQMKDPVEQVEYKEPEYVSPGEWDEPERPQIEQWLYCVDTRWSEPETEVISEEHAMSSITKSDIIEVKRHIDSTGYKKPVSKIKDGYKVDQFILRKVQ